MGVSVRAGGAVQLGVQAVAGCLAAGFLQRITGRDRSMLAGAVTDPAIATPQAIRGLAVVAGALVLPGSALACALAFRWRGRALSSSG